MPPRPSIPFLLDLLRLAMRKQAQALYIVPWMPPTLRVDENSVPLSSVSFTPEQSTLLVLDVLDDAQRQAMDRSREIQFSFVLEGIGRFQVHAFRRHGQPAMAIRPFATDVPTPRTLALPALACQLAMHDRGLLLVAGRSGALRRDVVAALLEHRNRNGQGDIALQDGATRYWHERVRCQVRQGLSQGTLDELLQRRATRMPPSGAPHGPMAVAFGELRDAAQLERAVRAAERCLALVTLAAESPLAALQQLLDRCAETLSTDWRHRGALALQAVLVVRGVPAAAGGAELAATEALLNSPDLAATLSEGELPVLEGLSADEHLWQLAAQGLVTMADAERHAVDRERFASRAQREPPRADPQAATAPVTVDTGFADLFEPGAAAPDPFAFADAATPPASADTQFDSVAWAGDDAAASSSMPLGTLGALAPRTILGSSAPVLATSAQFHAFAPAQVAPGATLPIDIWVALPGQAGEVAALGRSVDDPEPDGEWPGLVPQVALQLRIDGLLPAAAVQRLPWHAAPGRARFIVTVPARASIGTHAARVRLSVCGLPIGELSFLVHVAADAPPAMSALDDMHAARRMLGSAYAAFAHVDRDAVLETVQTLQLVAPGLDVFLDAPKLRSSERWRERIEREVARRERLFLFWSAAAAESPWVDFEWRLMQRRRGTGVIDALLLEPPRVAPLPPELADLVSAEVKVKLPVG